MNGVQQDSDDAGIGLKFVDPESGIAFVFDDDGRVAYGYLRTDDRYVSDVWLYNVADTPAEPEWTDRSKLPFLNPAGFASPGRFPPVTDADEISVEWIRDPSRGFVGANVFIRGECHARLLEGVKPGWCRLAVRDGPLAKVLFEM